MRARADKIVRTKSSTTSNKRYNPHVAFGLGDCRAVYRHFDKARAYQQRLHETYGHSTHLVTLARAPTAPAPGTVGGKHKVPIHISPTSVNIQLRRPNRTMKQVDSELHRIFAYAKETKRIEDLPWKKDLEVSCSGFCRFRSIMFTFS